MQEYHHLLCNLFFLHVHGGDLQHPAADCRESLLTHRERERETDRRGGRAIEWVYG